LPVLFARWWLGGFLQALSHVAGAVIKCSHDICAHVVHDASASNIVGGPMATAGKPQMPDPNEELVKVFDSDQESEVMVVTGLLESAGIDCMTSNLDAPQDILPGVGGVVVLVRAEQAEEARRLIEEYRASGESAADEAEAESETTGPAEEV
jgi:hypothetical protein